MSDCVLCRECIVETAERLWPHRAEEQGSGEAKAREAQEREDRRRRAKERQQRLIEEFANKQKQFMEKTMETGTLRAIPTKANY